MTTIRPKFHIRDFDIRDHVDVLFYDKDRYRLRTGTVYGKGRLYVYVSFDDDDAPFHYIWPSDIIQIDRD